MFWFKKMKKPKYILIKCYFWKSVFIPKWLFLSPLSLPSVLNNYNKEPGTYIFFWAPGDTYHLIKRLIQSLFI